MVCENEQQQLSEGGMVVKKMYSKIIMVNNIVLNTGNLLRVDFMCSHCTHRKGNCEEKMCYSS